MPSQELSETEQRIGFNLAGLPEEKWLLRVLIGLGCWALMIVPAEILRRIWDFYIFAYNSSAEPWGAWALWVLFALSVSGWFACFLGTMGLAWPERPIRCVKLRKMGIAVRLLYFFVTLIYLFDFDLMISIALTGETPAPWYARVVSGGWFYFSVKSMAIASVCVVFGVYFLMLGARLNMTGRAFGVAFSFWMLAAYQIGMELYSALQWDLWNTHLLEQRVRVLMGMICIPFLILAMVFLSFMIHGVLRLWKERRTLMESMSVETLQEMESPSISADLETVTLDQGEAFIASRSPEFLAQACYQNGWPDDAKGRQRVVNNSAMVMLMWLVILSSQLLLFPVMSLTEDTRGEGGLFRQAWVGTIMDYEGLYKGESLVLWMMLLWLACLIILLAIYYIQLHLERGLNHQQASRHDVRSTVVLALAMFGLFLAMFTDVYSLMWIDNTYLTHWPEFILVMLGLLLLILIMMSQQRRLLHRFRLKHMIIPLYVTWGSLYVAIFLVYLMGNGAMRLLADDLGLGQVYLLGAVFWVWTFLGRYQLIMEMGMVLWLPLVALLLLHLRVFWRVRVIKSELERSLDIETSDQASKAVGCNRGNES